MRRVLGLLSVIIALILSSALPASAATTAGSWQLNEKTGPAKDSSGNGNASKSIGAGITRNGATYTFTGKGSVVIPSAPILVAGSRNFTITTRVHLTKTGDENFFQKGGYNQTGTQWKLEISGNHLHCRVAGNQGVASVWAWGKAPALLSGFHTISCTKTATSVTLKLDAKSWTQKIAVGAINNTLPVSIGGKTNCKPAQCDFTSGSIDYATLQYQ
jgi:hypothetical protein